jgi:hypothetical protein
MFARHDRTIHHCRSLLPIPLCVPAEGARMFRSARLALLACLLPLLATPAFALPAPMSDQELNDKSDLVAVVRVLSVTCTTIIKDEKTGEDLPGYLAKLRLVDVKKGDGKAGDEILVSWRAIPTGIVGPWTVPYYPGEVVLTHLTKKLGGVSYGSTWWNAKGDDQTAPDSTALPTRPGETFIPPQERAPQTPL